jgi:hypothetical protein
MATKSDLYPRAKFIFHYTDFQKISHQLNNITQGHALATSIYINNGKWPVRLDNQLRL